MKSKELIQKIMNFDGSSVALKNLCVMIGEHLHEKGRKEEKSLHKTFHIDTMSLDERQKIRNIELKFFEKILNNFIAVAEQKKWLIDGEWRVDERDLSVKEKIDNFVLETAKNTIKDTETLKENNEPEATIKRRYSFLNALVKKIENQKKQNPERDLAENSLMAALRRNTIFQRQVEKNLHEGQIVTGGSFEERKSISGPMLSTRISGKTKLLKTQALIYKIVGNGEHPKNGDFEETIQALERYIESKREKIDNDDKRWLNRIRKKFNKNLKDEAIGYEQSFSQIQKKRSAQIVVFEGILECYKKVQEENSEKSESERHQILIKKINEETGVTIDEETGKIKKGYLNRVYGGGQYKFFGLLSMMVAKEYNRIVAAEKKDSSVGKEGSPVGKEDSSVGNENVSVVKEDSSPKSHSSTHTTEEKRIARADLINTLKNVNLSNVDNVISSIDKYTTGVSGTRPKEAPFLDIIKSGLTELKEKYRSEPTSTGNDNAFRKKAIFNFIEIISDTELKKIGINEKKYFMEMNFFKEFEKSIKEPYNKYLSEESQQAKINESSGAVSKANNFVLNASGFVPTLNNPKSDSKPPVTAKPKPPVKEKPPVAAKPKPLVADKPKLSIKKETSAKEKPPVAAKPKLPVKEKPLVKARAVIPENKETIKKTSSIKNLSHENANFIQGKTGVQPNESVSDVGLLVSEEKPVVSTTAKPVISSSTIFGDDLLAKLAKIRQATNPDGDNSEEETGSFKRKYSW